MLYVNYNSDKDLCTYKNIEYSYKKPCGDCSEHGEYMYGYRGGVTCVMIGMMFGDHPMQFGGLNLIAQGIFSNVNPFLCYFLCLSNTLIECLLILSLLLDIRAFEACRWTNAPQVRTSFAIN